MIFTTDQKVGGSTPSERARNLRFFGGFLLSGVRLSCPICEG